MLLGHNEPTNWHNGISPIIGHGVVPKLYRGARVRGTLGCNLVNPELDPVLLISKEI